MAKQRKFPDLVPCRKCQGSPSIVGTLDNKGGLYYRGECTWCGSATGLKRIARNAAEEWNRNNAIPA